ncbi:MAG: TonB-dependent receptor plug domain-containing protein [Flavobacterium sp.]|nr:TonB-dependent receptor plug domain-containing protein [Pedobacter sp.]
MKTKFPSGIVQFTLFSNSGDPLNERLVFIQNFDQLNLSIGTEKASFKQGDPVMIYLTARNSNSQLVKGTFSVSVVNEEIVPYDDTNEHTIFSDLLLTSDLKGYVEKPNYYFINITDDTRSDLDKLMLTQGYRRFEWNQLISGNIPLSNYKVEKGIAISGRLKSLFGKPIQNGTVSLIGPKGGLFKHTQTDGKGKFAFEDLTFSDTSEVMIQAQTQKGNRNVVINLEKTNTQFRSGKYDQYQSDIDTKLMPAYAENSRKQYGVQRKDAIQLQEVKITAIKIVQPHTSNMGGLGNYDEIITSDILTKGAGTLSQRLTRSGKLNGIIFQNGKPFNLRGRSLYKSDMTLVLDGVYIPDTLGMTIDDINPNDVSSVEILRNAGTMGVYGVQAGHGGIIVINSKKGNENNNNSKKYVAGLVVSNMRGFYPAKIFYIPKYKTFQENSRIQDFRSTILWQPNLVTDLYGRAMSNTFNSSISGTYRVIVEGMDMEGNIGREVHRYSIKE